MGKEKRDVLLSVMVTQSEFDFISGLASALKMSRPNLITAAATRYARGCIEVAQSRELLIKEMSDKPSR
jgi:hypothetical protein